MTTSSPLVENESDKSWRLESGEGEKEDERYKWRDEAGDKASCFLRNNWTVLNCSFPGMANFDRFRRGAAPTFTKWILTFVDGSGTTSEGGGVSDGLDE